MQAEITFSENTLGTKAGERPGIFPAMKPLPEVRRFIAERDWDERLCRCEQYINRFSWGIIIAAGLYLTPVCINIILR